MTFEEFKTQSPGATYADYYVATLKERVAGGSPHTSLGSRLGRGKNEIPFVEAGRAQFENFKATYSISPEHRVVDYGCGSFRIGIHFIAYLNRSNYFGLDLTRDFIDLGLEQVEASLGADHGARIGTIDRDLDAAIDFQPDFVISSNVAFHVHPDETGAYFGNLRRLTPPGGSLIFDGRISRTAKHFKERHWSWPLSYYDDQLRPLQFERMNPPRQKLEKRLDETDVAGVTFQYSREPRDTSEVPGRSGRC